MFVYEVSLYIFVFLGKVNVLLGCPQGKASSYSIKLAMYDTGIQVAKLLVTLLLIRFDDSRTVFKQMAEADATIVMFLLTLAPGTYTSYLHT